MAFIDDGLLALTALRGVAALNLQVGFTQPEKELASRHCIVLLIKVAMQCACRCTCSPVSKGGPLVQACIAPGCSNA